MAIDMILSLIHILLLYFCYVRILKCPFIQPFLFSSGSNLCVYLCTFIGKSHILFGNRVIQKLLQKISVSYTHLDVYKRQCVETVKTSGYAPLEMFTRESLWFVSCWLSEACFSKYFHWVLLESAVLKTYQSARTSETCYRNVFEIIEISSPGRFLYASHVFPKPVPTILQ